MDMVRITVAPTQQSSKFPKPTLRNSREAEPPLLAAALAADEHCPTLILSLSEMIRFIGREQIKSVGRKAHLSVLSAAEEFSAKPLPARSVRAAIFGQTKLDGGVQVLTHDVDSSVRKFLSLCTLWQTSYFPKSSHLPVFVCAFSRPSL